ncbi:MAG: hypothetical protein KME49_30390 [Brasilonema octagenarum HA4186-MV1]|jgi:hypothetical protein|uniref:Uncharacterized protein n=2 Tax=Brasilonema TaxID=383614 RepID=A0A856MKH5_9CYAN|nr:MULTISPECIES: hypothetical protein [Brasilonema]MBW4629705.1 hypothetical protein [Brasilonema octagenarum HA4186-MV1]NMF66166.1 hypothetical protein [Brasilonema octagenarum UFV-OR1]QDL09677.1 hypothetical protein DP114_18815 [Brasilonema sennae CENA114]QDL16031.1 hypothetical protein DP113_18745 [Brasilonema octagenarum UFV-E1]
MNNSKHSDVEIEILLLGKWRFNTSSEKVTIEFKDDMTYEQTKIQTFLFSKPKELLTGNKFTGVWYVNQKKLYLNVRSMPKSYLNLRIPLAFKIYIADIVATLGSVFMPEIYEIMRINSSKFLIMDKEESIIGTKIK